MEVKDELRGSKVIGSLKVTFNGTTIQGTCRSHKQCKGLLSQKPHLDLPLIAVEADVLSWVACGTELSHGEHQARFMALKRDVYKMKVRS